jgi:hypothetical protein
MRRLAGDELPSSLEAFDRHSARKDNSPCGRPDLTSKRRLFMSENSRTDDLASAVRYALETTRAMAICPFHEHVTIRVGDDDAEKHTYLRACNVVKSDGKSWEREVLREEIKRQLGDAADGTCPKCHVQK